MKVQDKIYTILCTLFAVLIVTGNLIYQKFVVLTIFSWHSFELSIGAILYPLTFLLTDLIVEFYGKESANFCVKLALMINVVISLIVAWMCQMDATNWSKINNEIFNLVFGFYYVAFFGSTIACYIAQKLDINIYLWIRKITQGKWLWLRNNGSTAISLLVDTVLVILFLTIFGILPKEQMWPLIINSYLFKLFFTVCSTPLFYILVIIIKKLIFQQERSNIVTM